MVAERGLRQQRKGPTLKEKLEDTAGLLVDQTGDTLDTSSARETADSRLGDTLDVVAQNLAVALGTSLSESLSSLQMREQGR